MYKPYYFKDRAQKRMEGEDVYGNKISVSFPTSVRNWEKSYPPYKITSRRVLRNVNQDVNRYTSPGRYNLPQQQNMGMAQAQLPIDYYPAQSRYMDPSTGAIPKGSHENPSFTHFEQIKKNYQENSQEGLYRTQKQNVGPDFNDSWSQGNVSFTEPKRNCTPNENVNKLTWPTANISGSFNSLNVISADEDFQFSNVARSNSVSNTPVSSPVELLVTNIDQTMDPQELKRILLSMFKEHVMVQSLNLFRHFDGNLVANVRVSSAQDAQYVISQLHRRKVGHKRVVISNAQSTSPNPHVLKSQVISLLQEVPGNQMPLFNFRELLESRYRTSVSVSELYKLRDVCTVSDELGGRMVSLASEYCSSPVPGFNMQMAVEVPHCVIHCPNGVGDRCWAEPEMPSLPNIRYKLKNFTTKVHSLLHSHMGALPLPSFQVCFEMELGEKLNIDDTGVPLEHLVTCVVGVDLHLGMNMVKYLGWGCQNGSDESAVEETGSVRLKCVSPPLANQLALFSRELVDLLKTAPHCQLLFSRFIPAYHHHFGRQCRVADYGYTKLVDLLDALSHIVQVIGEGNKRFITLSHTAQIRRFTSDLLRVLKSQASKQVLLSDFPAAYERVLSRPFDPVDYGLCEVEDLLEEVSENTVVVQMVVDDVLLAIPKKEQNAEEVLKTKQFALDVIDLLKHAPQYGILFNKFVPAYHHHFGHQCRVSDYGFTKLIELFEAIPDIVKIEETSDGERRVTLVPIEALHVVCDQITTLIKSSRLQQIPLVALPATFLREHGYLLRPELYECETLDEVIGKLSDHLQIVSSVAGPMVCVMPDWSQQQFGIRLWALLVNYPHKMDASGLIYEFQKKYGFGCTMQQVEKCTNIVKIEKKQSGEIEISLTPKYVVAANLYHLLFEAGGTLYLGYLDGCYRRKYEEVLRPANFGAATLNSLLAQLSFLVNTKGRGYKRNVSLNTGLSNYGLPLPSGLRYMSNEQNSIETNNNSMQWPPPPAHTYLFNKSMKTVSPPKPDTPPTNAGRIWDGAIWNISPSTSFSPSMNLCIPLPPARVSVKSLFDGASLVSPMKDLLPAYEQVISAPDPSHLPMPNADLLGKAKVSSPSKDSGISSTSINNSSEEPDSSTSFDADNKMTPTKKKRQVRLAAHFNTPLN